MVTTGTGRPSRPVYPPTRRDDVAELLHGERVVDPYRWLEDGESEETRAWTAAQNALTERYLAGVSARYAIRSIPTVLFVRQGKVVDQLIGAVPKAKIKEKLDALA